MVFNYAQVINGDIQCPQCGAFISTPLRESPFVDSHYILTTKRKTLLVPYELYKCSLCNADYTVDVLTAHNHNKFWYDRGL